MKSWNLEPMNLKPSFVFWGTPAVASETLEILKQNGDLPALIVTAPDRPRGRGMKIEETPVARFAKENQVPCLKPEKLDSEFSLQLSTFNFQLSVVVAYGKILPEKILKQSKFINIHYSLLPKYRGASPVESAILEGETETGVTIQRMVLQLDAGPILMQEKVEITPTETALDLKKRLTKLGGEMLVEFLNPSAREGTSPYIRGGREGLLQNESKATYAKKIKKEDGLIPEELLRKSASDPRQSAILYNKFRAYAEWPRTFFFKDGKRIVITAAALEKDKFVIKKVIPEGGKETDWKT